MFGCLFLTIVRYVSRFTNEGPRFRPGNPKKVPTSTTGRTRGVRSRPTKCSVTGSITPLLGVDVLSHFEEVGDLVV